MRKNYDLEYKEYMSRMVLEDDRPISELARELDISRTTLSGWVQDYKGKVGGLKSTSKRKRSKSP